MEFAVAALEGIAHALDAFDDVETGKQVEIDLAGVADEAQNRLIGALGYVNAKALRLEPFNELLAFFVGNVWFENYDHVGSLHIYLSFA